MKAEYSGKFIEQVLVKLLTRGARSVKDVVQELNMNYHTAKYWLKRATTVKGGVSSCKRWSPSTHSDANFDNNLVVADNASAITHNSSGQVLTHFKEEKQ